MRLSRSIVLHIRAILGTDGDRVLAHPARPAAPRRVRPLTGCAPVPAFSRTAPGPFSRTARVRAKPCTLKNSSCARQALHMTAWDASSCQGLAASPNSPSPAAPPLGGTQAPVSSPVMPLVSDEVSWVQPARSNAGGLRRAEGVCVRAPPPPGVSLRQANSSLNGSLNGFSQGSGRDLLRRPCCTRLHLVTDLSLGLSRDLVSRQGAHDGSVTSSRGSPHE
jgi:hypothetical protein